MKNTGIAYVASKHNMLFHMFVDNVTNKYRLHNNKFGIPPWIPEHFVPFRAAFSMTIKELIEQLDCIKDAPGVSEYQIGILQLIEKGNGEFEIGTRIFLAEQQSKSAIGDVWKDHIDHAGRHRPIWLVRLP
jgi:hypothetical protein